MAPLKVIEFIFTLPRLPLIFYRARKSQIVLSPIKGQKVNPMLFEPQRDLAEVKLFFTAKAFSKNIWQSIMVHLEAQSRWVICTHSSHLT